MGHHFWLLGLSVHPVLWAVAPPPTEEVLTEIRNFVLTSIGSSAGAHCPPDPRVPLVPLSWPMVQAGTGAGVALRSLGIVQEDTPTGALINNFPARSFFDVFVDVNLPPCAGRCP